MSNFADIFKSIYEPVSLWGNDSVLLGNGYWNFAPPLGVQYPRATYVKKPPTNIQLPFKVGTQTYTRTLHMMVEGPAEYYRNHQIINDIHTNKWYVYDPADREVWVTTSRKLAQEYIIGHIVNPKITQLSHEGVEVLWYDHEENLYLVSVKNEVFEKYPELRTWTYSKIMWEKGINPYYHNKLGPANICVDTNTERYFFNGEKLSREKWEVAVHTKDFQDDMHSFLKD